MGATTPLARSSCASSTPEVNVHNDHGHFLVVRQRHGFQRGLGHDHLEAHAREQAPGDTTRGHLIVYVEHAGWCGIP
jgi:hypothetical protein